MTCVVDDIIELPGQSMEALGAAFQAYEDLGMRANVSGDIINKPFTDTIPYAAQLLPKELLDRVSKNTPPSTADYLEFSKEALSRFQNKHGRLRYVIAPSGPQRCTDDLLAAAHELAVKNGAPYHIHILETKTQAVTGREFYGKTLIRHMHDIGALSERTTIAHSIWVTDDDIELMGRARCSIAHNPISNQKLGAGIAPFRKLSTPASISRSAPTASAAMTPRACSTSCMWPPSYQGDNAELQIVADGRRGAACRNHRRGAQCHDPRSGRLARSR